ncbi:UPF0688 protein C1orf174 homolog isoform X1 [Hippoglossus hippoglossus]|uniref:UPF0688 protein C1orf174 homolog isoform X1 n=2 Tax=Hippoglossus hippoglossus TaxID=8267 RepID=UPI00148C0CD3|nr:UPF0688 protein C1orf174 homolog isoform X1 [Hippoglossus hippoglossus]
MHEMPGQHGSLKSRKRKSSSEVKSRGKVSATRRRCRKSSKTHSATASSSSVSGHSKAVGTLSSHSSISCECHQSPGRRRCSASPGGDAEHQEGQEGKENELKTGLDVESCRLNSAQEKQEHEEMDYEETDKDIFPDDDSNQILPVEQFFGNLDIVQDFPEVSSATSASVQRKHRRRHYYAREDSDEEEVDCSRKTEEAFSDE